ncbi:TraD protein [Escherichia coli]|nr:TraD protein [Escherichia coli]
MASINTIVKRKQYLWLGIVVVGAASAIGGALYLSDVDMSGNGEAVAEQEPVSPPAYRVHLVCFCELTPHHPFLPCSRFSRSFIMSFNAKDMTQGGQIASMRIRMFSQIANIMLYCLFIFFWILVGLVLWVKISWQTFVNGCIYWWCGGENCR